MGGSLGVGVCKRRQRNTSHFPNRSQSSEPIQSRQQGGVCKTRTRKASHFANEPKPPGRRAKRETQRTVNQVERSLKHPGKPLRWTEALLTRGLLKGESLLDTVQINWQKLEFEDDLGNQLKIKAGSMAHPESKYDQRANRTKALQSPSSR
jgi:hypothetical protein